MEAEVEEWIRRKFEGLIKTTVRLTKEDLSMVSYTAGAHHFRSAPSLISGIISQTISLDTEEHSYNYASKIYPTCYP